AFTDDDCLPAPGWLEAGLARLDSSGAGIVQGRTLPDPAVQLEGWWRSITIDRFSHRYETCNIFYRTDVLRVLGGFDEGPKFDLKTGHGGEDVELGWRARRRGVEAIFAPEALVHHAVTFPGLGFLLRAAWHVGNWTILIRRFPEMRRELLVYRVFMGRRDGAFLAAVAGIAIAPVWLPALALAAPYALLWLGRNPPRLEWHAIIGKLAEVPFDAAVVAGLLVGSVRERTLVL
ncbi:MAG: glycosyltransferase family 2 protein, partial [Actinomycetota bacterium]